MHLISKSSLAFVTLAATLTLRAQPATATNPPGLLGQRYVEIGAGAIDPHGTSDTGFAAAASVNLPMPGNLDVGFGYTYSRLNDSLMSGLFEQRARNHALFTSATGYTTVGNVKPFLSALFGYQWSESDLLFGGTNVLNARRSQAVWGLAIGTEIPLAAVTITPRVSYQDGVHHGNGGVTYSAEAHTWFTKTVGAFAKVAFADPSHHSVAMPSGGVGSVGVFNSNGGGTESWTYTVGARFRF